MLQLMDDGEDTPVAQCSFFFFAMILGIITMDTKARDTEVENLVHVSQCNWFEYIQPECVLMGN